MPIKLRAPKDEREYNAMLLTALLDQTPTCSVCLKFASAFIVEGDHRKYTCRDHTNYKEAFYSDVNSHMAIMTLQMTYREKLYKDVPRLTRGIEGVK